MMKYFKREQLLILSILFFSFFTKPLYGASEEVTATAPLTEKQIPLNVETTKRTAEATQTPTRLFLTLVVLLAIAGTTYMLVNKYRASNSINKSNARIKVLSQHYLGPKKSLALVHVAGESILIGITDSNISLLKSISLIDDEVSAIDSGAEPKKFSDAMVRAEMPELDEEFSFAGVKDTVSKKIKSMRRFS